MRKASGRLLSYLHPLVPQNSLASYAWQVCKWQEMWVCTRVTSPNNIERCAMKTSARGRLVICVALAFHSHAVAADASQPTRSCQALDASHPRLMLKEADLGVLRACYSDDPALQKCWQDAQKDANECLDRPPLVYRKVGPRLLSVSRDCLRRIYSLALAYRWTGEEKYAAKAKENLLQVCAFPDWNPVAFSRYGGDVPRGGRRIRLAVRATSMTRPASQIRAALIEKGLKPGLEVYAKDGWWAKSEYNWNQVCNGGMIVGALAIAETDPSYAERIVPAAVKSLPHRAARATAPTAPGARGRATGATRRTTPPTA